MHESNEPGTAGDNHNEEDRVTPSDTLPPRRRRRAASRPAGPPVAAGGEEVVETVAAPAPAAEPVEDDVPAPRTRRRATRKATAPAGAPQVGEAVEPAAEAAGEEEAPAPRTRRRATRKTAAPEPVAGAVSAEAVSAESVVAEGTEEAVETVEAEAVPARRTRRRASAPAGAPQAGEAVEPAAEAVAEEEAPAPRKRRRATRKTAAPEPVAEAVSAEAAEETVGTGESLPVGSVSEIASHEDEVTAAEKAATRGRKRQAAAPAEFTAQQTEPTGKPARAGRPAVALFQAPVFAEPMFQTPETAAAAAAAAAAADVEDEEPAEDETAVVEAEAAPEPEPEPAGRRRRRRRSESAEQPAAAAEESEQAAEEAPDEGEEYDESDDRPSRRRRRGGRRRRRGESGDTDETSDEQHPEPATEAAAEESADEGEEQEDEEAEAGAPAAGSSSSRRRRRRRRRSGESGADDESDTGDPERTVVKVREPRAARTRSEEPSDFQDAVQSIKGSTRLEAKKQRRREGREQGRRRVPIITEAEFLARREAVERVMVVRQSGERTQIGVLEDNVLVEHYVNKEQSTSYVGNVYLGKVQNVLPSMEAAFVDIGKGRNAVLYAGEVNFEALGMSGGPRRIEAALKSGQSVLVQVTKDPIGHKGARLTSQVSLPGRYLVYVPEGSMTGISRKLPDTERARLKTILKKIVPEDAGVIVRTAAEGASEDELRRDVERLQSQWEDIKKKTKSGGAPSLLYGEPDMTVRVVRDIFNEDFSKVIVSGDEAWETVHGYVAHVAPDLVDRLQRWTSEVDVFATYRIDEQLMKALDRKVWLPSGGSLVIDKTEAMVVIDVNTGKFTGQGGNLEETVTRNNLEAAEEIVRQLRLRDLGGIVVVDFIDMVLESNRDLVMRRLLECLGRDRTKHQVAEVTSLGLVQMTRKRVGQGLLESFSETCVHCNGRGVIVHMEQPTSVGGGGGGKRSKKRGRGGAEQPHEHEAVAVAEAAGTETEAEIAAEVAEPVALAAPAFVPDEELYNSAAEAEAAAQRGRGRRRATRRASAPSGSPKAAEAQAAEAEIVTEAAPAAPAAVEPEPAAAESVAAPEAPEAPEPAPAGRTRRRATRKATAPAGSPKASEPEVVVETKAGAAEPEAPGAEAAPAEQAPAAEVPAQEEQAPAAPRARRRVTRKVTAPAGSPTGAEEAAVVVVDATPGISPDDAAGAPEPEAEAAPARKAARKTAKKATAKKAATKKTAAKKSAAKKATAKKAAKKTTAAAEQQALPSVTAVTEN
ncbi:ribonuclease E/G [Streptomyces sp. NPDC051018]|uniref:ribonuclease E/G n=1 Tax=Streptomyces sp. NPDC051018 TaxID=3365639 RepID=UPI0037925D1E